MISTTAQINTFGSGMNMDYDVAIIPDGEYRYAENVRIMTNDAGTSGSLLNIEGVKLYTLSSSVIGENETIIGTSTIHNYGIIITVEGSGSDVINRVYRIEGFDDGNDTLTSTVILKGRLNLCSDLDSTPNVSVVSNYESDQVVKIYFTDGNSAIKQLNIVNDKYVESDTELVDSEGFLINTKALDITPGAILTPFKIAGLGTGNLPVGVVLYCYLLFNLRGSETTVSPMSPLVHLTSSTTNQNSQDYQGDYPDNSSGKSCTLEADFITKDFDKCRIISIRYTDNNSIPRIVIVDEISLSKEQTKITYTDSGNAFLGEITIDEFNNLTGYQFFAKTITKMQNRLFVANVTEDTWNPEWDARAYRANSSGEFLIQHGDGSTVSGILTTDNLISANIPEDYDCINPYNDKNFHNTSISERYDRAAGGEYLGGTGINVSYRFVTAPIRLSDDYGARSANDTSMNVASVTGMSYVDLSYAEGTYFGTHVFLDNNDYRIPNYADPTIAAELTGYNRDEVYRFGVILYNDKSLPSPVYWIGDIRFPHSQQCPAFTRSYVNNATDPNFGKYIFNGHALGVVFYVNNLPEGTTAYEIVRCDRTEADRSVLMQCALSNLYSYKIQEQDKGVGIGTILSNSVEMRSHSLPTFVDEDVVIDKFRDDFDSVGSRVMYGVVKATSRVNDYYKIFSPEICVQQEAIETYITNSSYLDYLYFLFSLIDDKTVQSSGQFESTYLDVYTSYNMYTDRITQSTNTRVFASPEWVLQNTGKQSRTMHWSNWVGNNVEDSTTHPYNALDFLMPWGVALDKEEGIGFISEENTFVDVYYNGSIAKYYNVVYTNSDTTYELANPILDVKYPQIPPYNAFSSGVLPYRTNIGDKMFTNWNMSSFGDLDRHSKDNYQLRDQPINGPGGSCLIVKTALPIPGLTRSVTYKTTGTMVTLNGYDYANALPIFNIKRNVTPYGGITHTSRLNSVYMSTNGYRYLNDDVINYKQCVVYGGDTYLNLLDYLFTATYQPNDDGKYLANRHYVGCYIPFESSINMNLFNGDMAHRTSTSGGYLDTHLQIDITQKGTYHVLDRPYYLYNPVYSSQNGSRQYVPSSIYSIDNLHSSNRIYTSELKINNEVLDAWTAFKVANYLDVDSQWGEITNLVNFNDRLMFFQDTALGVASVNDRVLIDDGNIGQLTLGTGGVLERFDYLTTGNGSSIVNDRSITTTSSTLYWYDFDKNEICAFDNQINALSKNKFVLTYLNELYVDKRNVTLGLYDRKYNEVWFKFYDKSLIFNELVGRFTAFYTFNPQWALIFSDSIVGIKDNNLYRVNSVDTDKTNNVSKNAKVIFVVNKDGELTKTFDNVRLHGDFINGDDLSIKKDNVIKGVTFETKHLTTGKITDLVVDYREDSYRFAIPRQETNKDPMSYPARMRGKYLICTYEFEADGEDTFKIPSITTTYRYSLI